MAAKEGSKAEESAEKKKFGKGFAAFEKKEDAGKEGMKKGGKVKKFAAGGLAKTQSNLRSMGRGLARAANQKDGGKMKKGGKVCG